LRSCKEITQLISDSLERKLTWSEATELRLHKWVCVYCRRFQQNILALHRHLQALRRAAPNLDQPEVVPGDKLSEAAKQRIQASIDEATQQ
jgi:hypothetical protein